MQMNKTELVSAIAEKAEMTKKDAEKALNALVEVVKETLGRGDRIALVGFGTFEVRERKERRGRNPRTGEEMVIPGGKTAAFRPGKELQDSVR